MREVFETPEGKLEQGMIGVQYSNVTGQWNIKGKSADFGNPLIDATYGTQRANAYKILEDSLNLRDSRVYDTIEEDGKEKRILNKKETTLASQKQEQSGKPLRTGYFRMPGAGKRFVPNIMNCLIPTGHGNMMVLI